MSSTTTEPAIKAKQKRRRTPAFIKALSHNTLVRGTLCSIAAGYIRFAYATTKWTSINEEVPRAFWDANKPFIGAFWHGRMLLMPIIWQSDMPMNMLISNHRDGEFIAQTVANLGIKSVRGSTGDAKKGGEKRAKGGVAALRNIAKLAAAGEAIAVTPDGPRGPRMRASEGVATLSRITRLPVVPVAYATSGRYIFKTWDCFTIPLPFSKGIVVWGNPISAADAKAAGEKLDVRAAIEAALITAAEQADKSLGIEPIAPAPSELTEPANTHSPGGTA